MRLKTVITFTILIFAVTGVFAENGLFLTAVYNTPFDNEFMENNVSFGANYGFWGVFVASINMYTDILYDDDAFLNVDTITPMNLYSWGIGMQIPLGNFFFDIDWQNHYSNDESSDLRKYCSSYDIGFHIKLTESFGITVHKRTMLNFKDVSEIKSSQELDMVGIGGMFFL